MLALRCFVITLLVRVIRILPTLRRCWVESTNERIFELKCLVASKYETAETPNEADKTADETKDNVQRIDAPFDLLLHLRLEPHDVHLRRFFRVIGLLLIYLIDLIIYELLAEHEQ